METEVVEETKIETITCDEDLSSDDIRGEQESTCHVDRLGIRGENFIFLASIDWGVQWGPSPWGPSPRTSLSAEGPRRRRASWRMHTKCTQSHCQSLIINYTFIFYSYANVVARYKLDIGNEQLVLPEFHVKT